MTISGPLLDTSSPSRLDLLHHILATSANPTPDTPPPQTLLLVCEPRATFLAHLASPAGQQPLRPTLETLSTARSTTLAFVPSLPALLAYLSRLPATAPPKNKTPVTHPLNETPPASPTRLILANLLSLLAPTPNYSAQGLARAVAAAVDAAAACGARLVLVECVEAGAAAAGDAYDDAEMADGDDRGVPDAARALDFAPGRQAAAGSHTETDTAPDRTPHADVDPSALPDPSTLHRTQSQTHTSPPTPQPPPLPNPWSTALPVLNPTTRTLGAYGAGLAPGVLGRTVRAGDVVARWCCVVGPGAGAGAGVDDAGGGAGMAW